MLVRNLGDASEGRAPARPPSARGGDPNMGGEARPAGDPYIVSAGEYMVAGASQQLICIGLGSCVGIAIFDPGRGLGGLIHAMLPCYTEGRDRSNAAKYADTSIMLIADELVDRGADRSALQAKMTGGAQMFSSLSSENLNIGLKNTQIARRTLMEEGIPLIAEDVGGNRGRTVLFDPFSGSLQVHKGGEIIIL